MEGREYVVNDAMTGRELHAEKGCGAFTCDEDAIFGLLIVNRRDCHYREKTQDLREVGRKTVLAVPHILPFC